MKSWTIALASAALVVLTSAMPFDKAENITGDFSPALYLKNTVEKNIIPQNRETTVTLWSASNPKSRIANAMLSRKRGASHIGICMDNDSRLAERIIMADGKNNSIQLSGKDVKENSLANFIGDRSERTLHIGSDGKIISVEEY